MATTHRPSPVEAGRVGDPGHGGLSVGVGVEVVPSGDLRQGEPVVEDGIVVEVALAAVRRAGLGELGVVVDDPLLDPLPALRVPKTSSVLVNAI